MPTVQSSPNGSAAPHDVPAHVMARLGPVVPSTFSGEDFHRVDMRSIARDAGMSFATIYRHFRDEESLLFRFIAYWLGDLYRAGLQALDADESPLVRLQKYLRVHLAFQEKHPEIGRIIFMTVPLERWMRDETFRANEPVRRRLAVIAVIAEGQALGEIRGDVSRVAVLDAWSGIFNRAFLMWEYRGRSYSLTGRWKALCRVLVGGIAPPAAAARAAPAAAPAPAPGHARQRLARVSGSRPARPSSAPRSACAARA